MWFFPYAFTIYLLAIDTLSSYLQCTPAPAPAFDLFPKPCNTTLDCFPNVCCQESGKKFCRPPKRSLLAFLTTFAQVCWHFYLLTLYILLRHYWDIIVVMRSNRCSFDNICGFFCVFLSIHSVWIPAWYGSGPTTLISTDKSEYRLGNKCETGDLNCDIIVVYFIALVVTFKSKSMFFVVFNRLFLAIFFKNRDLLFYYILYICHASLILFFSTRRIKLPLFKFDYYTRQWEIWIVSNKSLIYAYCLHLRSKGESKERKSVFNGPLVHLWKTWAWYSTQNSDKASASIAIE